jgi:uncharacterized protein
LSIAFTLPSPIDLADLRRFAIARSFFARTDLRSAFDRLGFVQADPIRAPARAQDLVLRHRVAGYRAGDLDRRYPTLDIEEDFFVNYGFLPRAHHALMHPRVVRRPWSVAKKKRAQAVLAFVRERGEVHPRDVDERFAHGAVVNAWGGSSNATTHLLDAMHYRGWLRVARRQGGIRIYATRMPPTDAAPSTSLASRLDALVDVAVRQYAPLPATSLGQLVRRLRFGAPQLQRGLDAALARAKRRLAHARVDGAEWYWPAGEAPKAACDAFDGEVRLLAPFDPLVWDRARFERFWGWAYRFEAYTPVAKRKLGYYALPMLWREQVIGWANLALIDEALTSGVGYVAGRPPRDRHFRSALEGEIERIRVFLSAREAAAAEGSHE